METKAGKSQEFLQPRSNQENKTDNTSGNAIDPETFFAAESRFITDIAQGLPVTFKPGNGWAVDCETGEASFDPSFFTEQGYTRAQAQFATAHEIDHVVELSGMLANSEGREIHERRKPLLLKKRRLHILQNSIKDIADNQRVIRRTPGLQPEIQRLYREKLFPSSDMRNKPNHLQFVDAIIRTSMLAEAVQVSPEVEEAISKLRQVTGKKGVQRDVIKIITGPDVDLTTKIKLLEKYIEPVYEELFEKDKKEKEQSNTSGQSSGNQQGNPEDDFKQDYDEYDKKFPHAFDDDQVEAAATGANAGASMADRQKAGYEKEHGVVMQDILDYRREYQKVDQYVEENKRQYRRIIEERLIPEQRLGNITDEGVIIEPGLAAIAQEEFDRGNVNPMVFRDFEGRVVTEKVPGVFELTGIFDRSSSMVFGGKKEEQRRAAILLMESLNEFMQQPEIRRKMLSPSFSAASEIRSFGGTKENVIIKPLSSELAEKQRVEVFKTLNECTGGATEDYVVLGQLIDEIKARDAKEPGYLERVKRHAVKKLVVVFSDGDSSNQTEYDKRRKELEQMGITIVDYRAIKDGTNFTSHMSKILADSLDTLCYPKKRVQ